MVLVRDTRALLLPPLSAAPVVMDPSPPLMMVVSALPIPSPVASPLTASPMFCTTEVMSCRLLAVVAPL